MDSLYFWKLDPDPHKSEKLEPDPQRVKSWIRIRIRVKSQMPDPNPHSSKIQELKRIKKMEPCSQCHGTEPYRTIGNDLLRFRFWLWKALAPVPIPDPENFKHSYQKTKNLHKILSFQCQKQLISKKAGLSFFLLHFMLDLDPNPVPEPVSEQVRNHNVSRFGSGSAKTKKLRFLWSRLRLHKNA